MNLHYTPVPNALLMDERLDSTAKMIAITIIRKYDDNGLGYTKGIPLLKKELGGLVSRATLYRKLSELELLGYISREQIDRGVCISLNADSIYNRFNDKSRLHTIEVPIDMSAMPKEDRKFYKTLKKISGQKKHVNLKETYEIIATMPEEERVYSLEVARVMKTSAVNKGKSFMMAHPITVLKTYIKQGKLMSIPRRNADGTIKVVTTGGFSPL